jgi:hypothetical protein
VYCDDTLTQITLNEFGVPFAYVIPNILANRLLIGVRSLYYKSPSDADRYLPSLQFAHSGSRRSTISLSRTSDSGVLENHEVQPFNERAGV